MSGTTGITGPSTEAKWSNKDIVKKSPNAEQVLEALPIKFKKIVRQLIDFYESERIDLRQQIELSPTSSLELYAYRQKLEELVYENSCLSKDIDALRKRNKSINDELNSLTHLLATKESQLEEYRSNVHNFNNTLEIEHNMHNFRIASLEHQNFLLEAMTHTFRDQLAQSQSVIQKLKQAAETLNTKLLSSEMEFSKITNLKNDAVKKAEKLDRQLRKKRIVQIRTTLSQSQEKNRETPKTPGFDQPQTDFMRTSCFRKLSEVLSPTLKLKPTRSITQTIKRAKEIIGNRLDIKQQEVSEPDSLEFGKEKVIEKKKIRKFLSDIFTAQDCSKRRIVLEQLSHEIGLRQSQIDQFDSLF